MSGTAVVWGAAGLGGIEVSGVAVDGLIQSYTVTPDAESVAVRDITGQTIGFVDSDHYKTLVIEVIPNGTSRQFAKNQLGNLLPAKGSTVKITDEGPNNLDSLHAGAWRCESAEVRRVNAAIATVSMTLKQYVGADVTKAVT